MSASEIEHVLASQSATNACRALVQLAKDRGGPDNITLQIARIVG
jgi:serine/threonine protein phosphatase PrpC